ncbi:MAG: hypothetical protein UR89_C0008G0019 [Candidatus Roizmanbacteria bacterium GW2011_GWA2_35_8]|uniref:Uncharacterized protein n=1 Tax=Candidatus Roizmanbacteria bacterium GW2011_GWA2_35_8 TaxID=1618479 RepID=A0A0G0G5N4_9BACT|nr:MAG: hypothetical protein UR89_C0008G0019 [Candidatus Roizmanbacteria bacterium GW2011_GWA2_35_8]
MLRKMNNLNKTLEEIFQILSSCRKLELNECPVRVNYAQIITPIGDMSPVLFNHKSKLKNQIIDITSIKRLIEVLNHNDSIIRLNHIGFCYKVASQENEKKRIAEIVQKTNFHLYQEESNDDGLWLFIGNTKKWEKPLLELLPIEKSDDRWVEYFLPHIQFDVDTNLTAEDINKLAKKVFSKNITPYHIIIDGITYIVRNRLGVIDGVNIFLDLATNSRNVKFHRQNILRKIS